MTPEKGPDSWVRMRAERRLGELIRAQKETVGLNPGTRTGGTGGSMKAPPAIPTLAEAGIDGGHNAIYLEPGEPALASEVAPY